MCTWGLIPIKALEKSCFNFLIYSSMPDRISRPQLRQCLKQTNHHHNNKPTLLNPRSTCYNFCGEKGQTGEFPELGEPQEMFMSPQIILSCSKVGGGADISQYEKLAVPVRKQKQNKSGKLMILNKIDVLIEMLLLVQVGRKCFHKYPIKNKKILLNVNIIVIYPSITMKVRMTGAISFT